MSTVTRGPAGLREWLAWQDTIPEGSRIGRDQFLRATLYTLFEERWWVPSAWAGPLPPELEQTMRALSGYQRLEKSDLPYPAEHHWTGTAVELLDTALAVIATA